MIETIWNRRQQNPAVFLGDCTPVLLASPRRRVDLCLRSVELPQTPLSVKGRPTGVAHLRVVEDGFFPAVSQGHASSW